MQSCRKIVVTGMGVVTPLGSTLEAYWRRLINGESGIGKITRFDATAYATQIAGEVCEFNPDEFASKKEQRRMDPFSLYGLAAAKMAASDSGLDFSAENGERCGVILGTGIGGLDILQAQMRVLMEKGPRRFSPFMIPQMITNILSGQVAIEFGLQGPNFCVTSACATATHSIGEAMRIIRQNEADIMFAGGAESSVTEMGIGGFNAMRALSTRNDEPERASRPFDAERDGFVPSEGAGVLVLEEYEHAKARGARIYCELAGYGRTCDAYHITAPSETGAQAARGMSLAIEDAGVNPEDVDYVNAHGTSTSLNDKTETKAIKLALGEEAARRVNISSTKSMTGHLLGAAGAIEAVACVFAMQHGVVPPTINQDNPDPECDLDYTANVAREVPVKVAISNSLGFGGHNATLCVKQI